MAINVQGWPVMKSCYSTCPFGEGGDQELKDTIIQRIAGMAASQICHHPRMHGKKETHLCRGARDFQLTILHRMGMIAEPTDEAFKEASEAALCRS